MKDGIKHCFFLAFIGVAANLFVLLPRLLVHEVIIIENDMPPWQTGRGKGNKNPGGDGEEVASSSQGITRGEERRPRHFDNQRKGDFAVRDAANVQNAKFYVAFPWKPSHMLDLKPVNQLPVNDTDPGVYDVDFGSIRHSPFFERQIKSNDVEAFEEYRYHVLKSFDKPKGGSPQHDNDPPLNATNPCRRNAWMQLMFPTCNILHEVPYDRPAGMAHQKFQYNFVGAGQFRLTFVFKEVDGHSSFKNQTESFAIKEIKNHKYFDRYLRNMIQIIPYEALILERLTASRHIADIYSFCGTTSILEALPNEVNDMIQTGEGLANHTELLAMDTVSSKNNLTAQERVRIALDMAEGLAALHGYRDGVIVHGDNHIDQFLADANGVVKLGDFNLATILEWNEGKGEYCKNERVPWKFAFRAPEEIGGVPFDEKIDVFTLGNSIYSLVTGLKPFYDSEQRGEICERILKGERSFIDPRYRSRPVDAKLLEILDRCWAHTGEDRIDIFEVVAMLRKLADSIGVV